MENIYRDFQFPPYITLAHLFHAPANWGILDRRLNEYALQYVVKGCAEYEIEGAVHLTQEGDMIIHRPAELHSIRMLPGQSYVCISLVFHFGGAAFPLDRSLNGNHACGNYLGSAVNNYLSELVIHYKKPTMEARLRCQALFMLILSEIEASLTSNSQNNQHMKKLNRMILIKNHIVEHYQHNLDFTQLEQISGMSKNYLISAFTKTFHISPVQYQLIVRIQKAKELAIHSGLSVGEIANRVGYSDVHSFGKMFKKKTGYSLSEFCSTLVIRPLVYNHQLLPHRSEDGC
ncbi:AraC family transcriptional regulator [Paenibacillus sp. FSL H8-0034]|uniref:AraC family transcriptional regulator n=1 Tax=Paenibacillus sp. FSL H8-0034 TaxID=2954671 RepID=UPI0030F769E9